MRRKIILCLFIMILTFSLTGCGEKKKENNNNENSYSQEQKTSNKEVDKNSQNNNVDDNDEIIEYDDNDNVPPEEGNIVVEKVINCDGCVYSYFSETKTIGSTLSQDEYTTDVNKLKTSSGKQRHNFFGFVLEDNKISKAYSCILKDNKIYCIQGSDNDAYFNSNIGVLNQIFTNDQCRYISNGHTYTCTDGSYNGDTITTGYAALHYDTSCTIYGSEARTGELICH